MTNEQDIYKELMEIKQRLERIERIIWGTDDKKTKEIKFWLPYNWGEYNSILNEIQMINEWLEEHEKLHKYHYRNTNIGVKE